MSLLGVVIISCGRAFILSVNIKISNFCDYFIDFRVHFLCTRLAELLGFFTCMVFSLAKRQQVIAQFKQ